MVVLVECSNSNSRNSITHPLSSYCGNSTHVGSAIAFLLNAYNYVNCTMNMQNTTYVRVIILYIYVPVKCYRKILHSYNCCRKPHHHFVLFKYKNFYSTGCTQANIRSSSWSPMYRDQESIDEKKKYVNKIHRSAQNI